MAGRAPRTASTASSDGAVAGVVGAVLVLALAVTAYAHVARTDVPRWGADAERAWDADMAQAMLDLSRGAGTAVGSENVVSVSLPAPAPPRALDVPLLGRTVAATPGGTVVYEPSCTRWTANHTTLGGLLVKDFISTPSGCVIFRAATTYVDGFSYRAEAGGVLRIQGNRAVVVAGPQLELDNSSVVAGSNVYRIALNVPTLRGSATSTSNDKTSVAVNLVPAAAALDREAGANAVRAVLDLETAYPAAWKTWFQEKLLSGGYSSSSFTVACDTPGCSLTAGRGHVVVTVLGPEQSPVTRSDLSLQMSHGVFDAALR